MSSNTKIVLTASIIAVVVMSTIAVQSGFAFSDRYSAQQRFSSGYQDGMNMCNNQAQIIQYKHSAEYRGHSDDYHHGFFSGSHNCQAANDVDANGIIGDGNGNQGQSTPTQFSKITANSPTDNSNNQNNRDQNQGQSNNQKSTCIGICYGSGPSSFQNQGLGN
jgi:hypothetical protein